MPGVQDATFAGPGSRGLGRLLTCRQAGAPWLPHAGRRTAGERRRAGLHRDVDGFMVNNGVIVIANGGITACAETAQLVARQVAERYPAGARSAS